MAFQFRLLKVIQKHMSPKQKHSGSRKITLDELDKIVADSSEKNRNFFIAYLILLIYIQFIIFSTTDLQLLTGTNIGLPFAYLSVPLKGFYFVAPLFIITLHLNFLQNLEIHHYKLMRWLYAQPKKMAERALLKPFLFDHAELSDKGVFHQLVRHANNFLCLNLAPFTIGLLLWRYSDQQDFLFSVWYFTIFSLDSYWVWRFRDALKENKSPHTPDSLKASSLKYPQIETQTKQGKQSKWPVIKTFFTPASVKESVANLVAHISRYCITSAFTVFLFITALLTFSEVLIPSGTIEWLEKNTPMSIKSLIMPVISIKPHEQLNTATLGNAAKPTNPPHIVAKSLRFATLKGVSMENAELQDAQMQQADLSEACLKGAKLAGANMQGANLSKAHMEEASLSNAILEHAVLFLTRLPKATLEKADLHFANMREANLDSAILNGAQLREADLTNASLKNAALYGANFEKATLTDANLTNAQLNSTYLNGANLTNAKLMDANLKNAELRGADLSNANFQGASLKDADLRGAKLNATNFKGSDLTNVKFQGAIFHLTNITELSSSQKQDVFLDDSPFATKKRIKHTFFKHVPKAITTLVLDLCKPEKNKQDAHLAAIEGIRRNYLTLHIVDIDTTLCEHPSCTDLIPLVKNLDCNKIKPENNNIGHE